MNILMCSVGRRGELLKNIKKSIGTTGKIVATDKSKFAPAIYLADKYYFVPEINDVNYISTIIDICKEEEIDVVTTFIDPEIEILSKYRDKFSELGIIVLAPYYETARLCFDKYEMAKYLDANEIRTVKTWGDIDSFSDALSDNLVSFPVFVKPRTGSGSVGARKICNIDELYCAVEGDNSLIIQEFMNCDDLDADVYVDTISHDAVSIFTKKKIETKIGGANKTYSFKDDRLNSFILDIVRKFKFNGPIDMDFFCKDGEYYLSEINPRFGGAYLHAYGAGVDFIKLIENNVNGIQNEKKFNNYEDNVVMMMYDSVVIQKMDSIK